MDELAQARRAKLLAATQRQEAADRAKLMREGSPMQTYDGPLPISHPQNGCGESSADDTSAKRIAELEDALDNFILAAELPGDHCEMQNALRQAKIVLAKRR